MQAIVTALGYLTKLEEKTLLIKSLQQQLFTRHEKPEGNQWLSEWTQRPLKGSITCFILLFFYRVYKCETLHAGLQKEVPKSHSTEHTWSAHAFGG